MKLPTDPAAYPAKHVTPSCWPIEQSSFFLLTIFRYKKSTECSNVENITMETAQKKREQNTYYSVHLWTWGRLKCSQSLKPHISLSCYSMRTLIITRSWPVCIFEYSAWLAWKKSIVIFSNQRCISHILSINRQIVHIARPVK